jgi:hypothetical protein
VGEAKKQDWFNWELMLAKLEDAVASPRSQWRDELMVIGVMVMRLLRCARNDGACEVGLVWIDCV